MSNSPIDPESRFAAETIEEVDGKLNAEGWVTGFAVRAQVEKAYIDYLRGDNELAEAQLESLFSAIRDDSA